MEFLDEFIKRLLHTDDVRGNRLIDVGRLGEGGSDKAYRLFCSDGQNSRTMLKVIRARRGKPSNKTVLSDSAIVKATVGPLTEAWDWSDLAGNRDVNALDKFISSAYNALDLKGNNPLFLGMGLLTWAVAHGDEIRQVNSPLLIFPIRLVRGTNTSPVEIEFVDDDAYFNPCLIARMRDELPEIVSTSFPHPNGAGGYSFDDALDLDKLGDGAEYMKAVEEYIATLAGSGDTISFDKDIITIAQYNHSDICMYYDVRRNKQKIYDHPLVRRIFGGAADRTVPQGDGNNGGEMIRPVLPTDSVQDKIISRVAAGESLIIKGPPGTGKTLTIANMLATLLAQGKSVLVASEKLSALAEVYAKLPERLRKFVMLLDYETEQKAAAVNPAKVRAEFKKLVKYKKEYVYDGGNDMRYSRADRAKAEAMIALAAYQADMFGSDVAWGSYYDALDEYYKHTDLPVIEFTDGGTAASISREDYNKLILNVKECAAHYARLSADGEVPLSAWYGVTDSVDTERAMAALIEIAAVMTDINACVEGLATDPDISWQDCTYGDLHDAALPNAISGEDIIKVVGTLTQADGELLENLTADYESLKSADSGRFKFNAAPDKSFLRVQDISLPRGIKLSAVKDIAQNSDLFLSGSMTDKAADKFAEIVGNIAELKAERDSLAAEVIFVFDRAEQNDTQLLKSCAAVAPYADDKSSIGLFDFKARSAEKKLRAVCSRNDITLTELAKTATSYMRIAECDGKISGLCDVLAHVIGRDTLTAAQTDCILTVARYGKESGEQTREFVTRCKAAAEIIAVVADFVQAPDDYVIDDFKAAVAFACAANRLDSVVGTLCDKCGIAHADNALVQVQSISALLRIYRSPQFNGDAGKVQRFVSALQADGAPIVAAVSSAVKKLKEFGEKYFVNAYARAAWLVTPKTSRILIKQARDRSALNAALGYDTILNANNALPIDAFFAPIEDGRVNVLPEQFVDLFVHSYLSLVIDNKLSVLGNRRNGLSKNAELAIKNFTDAEKEILECNAVRTESLCMARINADDDDFDFLAVDKGISMSLRMMFRMYGNAILKLKRCFILSPSTASVLFRGDAYESFDVVIVDEASQMEPVDMLPVLFRSKQCVLVGDEFQMPPLTHFKAKNRKRISDENTELTLDTDISALSLALGNLAFGTEELVCHYRSKTESLIEFSQREFYPYMRTFPAIVPGTDELGFTDIHTPDGYCEDGVNAVEANAVIKALHEHFDKYYDNKRGTLGCSVGVVTFGEAQLKHVLSLVHADKKLNDMIETAWRNYDDVPDKLVFFRTIESVQGQETNHLILSLTYGRDKNGKVKLAFGELNRDATGKNIFNVAVTRAKNKVTVIHSLTAQQMIGNERIAFIRSYLMGVERYSQGGRSRFVSCVPEKGEHFISAVADYIESLGIARERIVQNYGVTDGSIRIPIAVLNKDLSAAELGVWCEYPVQKKYDFFDYNARYYSTLASRGWTLYKVYAHDFFDNADAEKAALKAAVQKHVTR